MNTARRTGCSHLFGAFKSTLERSGHAGIVAIHLDHGEFLPGDLMEAVALLLRKLGRRLSGQDAGTYKSGMQDFFLLLIPSGPTCVAHYREQGYSIAIDDLGSGYAGLQILARLEPEYVKLSRFLIASIEISPTRQALVESLVMFCNRTGARVIAEGIERQEELAYLRALGIHFGQGYLLAKPSTFPSLLPV